MASDPASTKHPRHVHLNGDRRNVRRLHRFDRLGRDSRLVPSQFQGCRAI